MGSDQSFVDHVVDRIETDCDVTYKKMFGEYGLYSHGKMFAVVCDNQLFIKPTEEGRAFIGDVTEAPPYPGAKPSFLIGARMDDSEWLSELVRITTRALPEPKKRKRAKKKK
ncbi:MAG: TfoX/Sxy family protein [Gemmatimonadota bacterium]|nr:TfoX/Sxy family protein [Gemmatimonadota bacterium]